LLKQFLFLFYFIFQGGAVRVGRREWHSQTGGGGYQKEKVVAAL
jgi:hypothetical protein